MNYNCFYSIVFLCFNVLYSLCCCYILPVLFIHLTFELYAPPLCITQCHFRASNSLKATTISHSWIKRNIIIKILIRFDTPNTLYL